MSMMTMLTVRTDFASLHDFPVGWEERVHATLATKLALHARKFDFCFLLISSSLGFGNMYRFPSLILKYGGQLFVHPAGRATDLLKPNLLSIFILHIFSYILHSIHGSLSGLRFSTDAPRANHRAIFRFRTSQKLQRGRSCICW